MPLRIFEPRYLEMVGDCLRSDSGFGICLIRDGSETGRAATFHEVGTLCRISYWQRLPNNMLGITVRGERRFRVLASRTLPNQLTRASVELLPEEQRCPLAPRHHQAAQQLCRMLERLGLPYNKPPTDYEDATWVGCRLAELLPLPLGRKQQLLQLSDPLQRLEELREELEQLGGAG